MKKLTVSLAALSVVAISAVGSTGAYFNDVAESHLNTLSTGTIDINIADKPWTDGFNMSDMKPGYTEHMEFKVNNTGTNPVNVKKQLKDFAGDNGTVNEPECLAEGGTWSGSACNGGTAKYDLQNYINYGLKVAVYDSAGTKIWWQTIHDLSDKVKITEAYADGKILTLGMVPAGGYMMVEQDYNLDNKVENWAQADNFTFKVSISGEQLSNSVTLVSKSGTDWDKIDQSEQATKYAILSHSVKSPKFEYKLEAKGMQANTSYTLLIGTNPYDNADRSAFGPFVTNSSGEFTSANLSVDLGKDWSRAKVWLIPTSDWNGTAMTGWHGDKYLFETALTAYTDTDK